MKIEKKEDIANFIESHLKELGGEAYGVIYIAEKLFEWHESELKNLRLGVAVNRRELLLDFADYSERDKTSQATDECVDNYLDSIK